VLEVNSSPGLEGIEAATGVDIAGPDRRSTSVQGTAAAGGPRREAFYVLTKFAVDRRF
jgi:hypothetical protein